MDLRFGGRLTGEEPKMARRRPINRPDRSKVGEIRFYAL